ncbi:sigma-70 family RNA polymerase sigma factor [bacterium]|nr:sigma-70 family RNA polymerase sigma factor [bacterium]
MLLNVSKLDPDERLRGILRLYPHALAYLFHPHVFRMSTETRVRRSGNIKRSLEDWLSVKLEVEDLLDGLPFRERKAVTLYYLAGYKQREVAESLGVSQPRLAAILARARRRLVRRVVVNPRFGG